MIASAARTILRRRLKDPDGEMFTDDELLALMNQAIMQEQAQVVKVNPDAHLKVYRISTTGDRYYDIPEGMMFEVEVGFKDSDDATGYRSLERGNYFDIRALRSGDTQDRYARFSNKIYIGPTTSSVVDGLQIIGVPSLSVGDWNAELPLHISLHWAIILRTQIMALGETEENVDKLWAELKEVRAIIPDVYMKSGADSDLFRPDVVKGY